MFDAFILDRIDVGDAQLRVRHGGSGPPILLLHGHPRTHTTWHWVAPVLAREFAVVCPDLRGYGESSKPADQPDHAQMGKRALARDGIALMEALGHSRFAVVGHDRGLYVATRMALDHPDRISRLVVIDGVPIGEALRRADARFASAWWHWFFFGQTGKPAERVINQDPDAWYTAEREQMGEENYADFRRATRDPETVHAMLEDYRAGLTVDRAADEADRGRRATDHVPHPLCLVDARRPHRVVRGPRRHLARLDGRPAVGGDRQRPPHGRGGSRRARRRHRRVPALAGPGRAALEAERALRLES